MSQHFRRSPLLFRVCLSLCLVNSAARPQNVPARIEIVTIDGEGATSKAHQRVSRDPVVRVEDDDHRPVAGAAVVFALPVSGPSGEFVNGSKTFTAVTDKDGVATASGLRTNQVAGKLQVYVTGSYRGLRAKALVTQFIEAEPGTGKTVEVHASKSKWKWIALGVVAAGGAGAGAYFAQQRSSASPMSISTGAIVFGNPR